MVPQRAARGRVHRVHLRDIEFGVQVGDARVRNGGRFHHRVFQHLLWKQRLHEADHLCLRAVGRFVARDPDGRAVTLILSRDAELRFISRSVTRMRSGSPTGMLRKRRDVAHGR